MKLTKKIMASIISVVLITTTLTACGSVETVDRTKTQLYIGMVPTGFGTDWLYAAKDRFEALNAETVFESGKKGVQIFIEDVPAGSSIGSVMSGLRQEVIFTEDCDYYQLANSNLLYDITSIVDETIPFNNETESIADKMYSTQKEFYDIDGKYYAVPFNDVTTGIIYNIDIFERENLYFLADDTSSKAAKFTELPTGKKSFKFITSSTDTKSAGPDGLIGTNDDGLPATYEQFFALFDKLVTKDIIPITWAGQYQFYFYRFLYTLWANNEGFDQMSLNYTFDGTAYDLINSIDLVNGDVTFLGGEDGIEITDENGYLLNKQAGKYYALSFAEQLIQNTNYYDEQLCFSPAQQHLDAQNLFLMGTFSDSVDETAMLIDGSWWENEATFTFNNMENRYGAVASKNNRKFGMLPLPYPTDDYIGEHQKMTFDSNYSLSFINGNIESNKVAVAKAFFQFMHTRESFIEFTTITSMTKPFTYEATESEKDAMSSYGLSMMENREDALSLCAYSNNNTFLNNRSTFNALHTSIWQTSDYNVPSTAFRDNKITAYIYFNGLSEHYNESFWNNSILSNLN